MKGFETLTQADVDRALELGGITRLAVLDSALVGIKQFESGEVFENHYHETYDELFVGLAGVITIWQGRSLASQLVPGSSLACPRGVHHRLANLTDQPARLMFIKTSAVEGDAVWVPWSPDKNQASRRAE